jgi:hypothetical protein
MQLIKGETSPHVWTEAVAYLATCPHHQDFDVFLNVEKPTVFTGADRTVYELVDSMLRNKGGSAVETVAETIFPMSDYRRNGAEGVYKLYPERMQKIRSVRTDRQWGTYALRLLEPRVDAKGRKYVPLKAVVEKIKKHGKYKAAHELNLGHFEDDIEIYDPATDRLRQYGGPCLSHLSFKVYDGLIRLNATYRSHFYVQRLLGNLIGLGRMQVFIAKEANLAVGPLTINSTLARLDTGGGKGDGGKWGEQDIKKLIAKCQGAYAAPVVATAS